MQGNTLKAETGCQEEDPSIWFDSFTGAVLEAAHESNRIKNRNSGRELTLMR